MPGSHCPAFFDAMKILIIEDDKETRDHVSTGLKEAGHNIDSARDGYEGLLLAKEASMTCLLLTECCLILMGLPW